MNNLSKRQLDIFNKLKAHILTFSIDEELTFEKMYSNIEINYKHENEFYDMVFLLSRGKDAIIKQHFKVWHETFSKHVEFDSTIIKNQLRAKNYINPISNKVLSIDDYAKEVITYFKRIK